MKNCCYCNRYIWRLRYYSERICVGGNVNKYFYHDECYLVVNTPPKPEATAPTDEPNAPLTKI
jgi:hypothetical protein